MTIPYTVFEGEGSLLSFSHANGYPPECYTPFLKQFTPKYHVVAPWLRPLWSDQTPKVVSNWRVFGDDLLAFFAHVRERYLTHTPEDNKALGVGHSVGATSTLLAAMQRPDWFHALVLVEPILFLPYLSILWRVVSLLGLRYRLSPLIQGALKRKRYFQSREEMFENYRSKTVFRRISDQGLWEYVNALAWEDACGVRLSYPPAWEARVYAIAGLCDHQIWRSVKKLKIPVLLIQGAETDAFSDRTAKKLLKRLPQSQLSVIPETGHLAPLEAPESVFQVINNFFGIVGV